MGFRLDDDTIGGLANGTNSKFFVEFWTVDDAVCARGKQLEIIGNIRVFSEYIGNFVSKLTKLGKWDTYTCPASAPPLRPLENLRKLMKISIFFSNYRQFC